MSIHSLSRHALSGVFVSLLALSMAGCGRAPSCCDPQPSSESLAPVRYAEVTPLGASLMPPQGIVGRGGGTAYQVVMEFDGSLIGGRGTYVDGAVLSFYVHAVVGDPQAALGMLRIELVEPVDPFSPDSGLGDPIGAADFDDTGGTLVQEVAVPASNGLVQVDVTSVLQQHTNYKIAFRLSFAGASTAGPDALVVIATSISMSDPAPKLDIDGGIVGL